MKLAAALPVLLSLACALACSSRKEGKPRDERTASADERKPAPASMGELMVDGEPFVITSCAPGTRQKFVGFDLRSADKRRLWVSAASPGRARVHVFRSPALPVELGVCAEAEVTELEPPLGGVTGSFTAACDAVGHKVTGSVTVTECR